MRCLFCKADSSASRSVEHIIPESLGNIDHVLPPGSVCDNCNNHFGREVEKPFLEHPSIKALRFEQTIPSKRGVVPPVVGVLLGGFRGLVRRLKKNQDEASLEIEIPEEAADLVLNSNKGGIFVPTRLSPPTGILVSRFLAKCGLEALADALFHTYGGLDYLVDNPELDPVRLHALKGETPDWPFHTRSIYDPSRIWVNELGQSGRSLHEYTFLKTGEGEWYFVLVIFGTEFVLNLAGPDIAGYLRWLDEHDGASPLYGGKRAGQGLLRNYDVCVSTPHPAADPERASRLNIQYQRDLAHWKALSFWKRITTPKPKAPSGI